MTDLLLTADRDLDITNGALSFTVAGVATHAQRAKMHYETFLGESVYDLSAGVPWLQVILGSSLPPDSIRMILDLYGRQIPGIVSTSMSPVYDRVTRKLTFTGSIETIDGEVQFFLEPLAVDNDEEST